jgi:hypothetical protein
MPIAMKCPSCARSLRLPDSATGKTARCPECKSPVRVPANTSVGSAQIIEAAIVPPAHSATGTDICVGCGNPMRARVYCESCDIAFCSERCLDRHGKRCPAIVGAKAKRAQQKEFKKGLSALVAVGVTIFLFYVFYNCAGAWFDAITRPAAAPSLSAASSKQCHTPNSYCPGRVGGIRRLEMPCHRESAARICSSYGVCS